MTPYILNGPVVPPGGVIRVADDHVALHTVVQEETPYRLYPVKTRPSPLTFSPVNSAWSISRIIKRRSRKFFANNERTNDVSGRSRDERPSNIGQPPLVKYSSNFDVSPRLRDEPHPSLVDRPLQLYRRDSSTTNLTSNPLLFPKRLLSLRFLPLPVSDPSRPAPNHSTKHTPLHHLPFQTRTTQFYYFT